MARKLYARRYAQAAFEIAREKNELERWQADLKRIAAISQDASARALLETPRISFEDKVRLLGEKLPGADPVVLNLAYLLVTKSMFGIAGDISGEFDRLLNSHRGIEQAEVLTAVPLAEPEKQALRSRIKDMLGKEVILTAEVDPGLVGGIVIRVNDKLIDGSTRSRLLALKKELGGAVS